MEERDKDRSRSLAKLREDIEIGRQQSERGEGVDGAAVVAEIRQKSKLRADISIGMRQLERGEVVDSQSVFAEIKKLSKAKRAAIARRNK